MERVAYEFRRLLSVAGGCCLRCRQCRYADDSHRNRPAIQLCAEDLKKIAASPFWTGTSGDMYDLVEQAVFAPRAILPIGDAIDWIHFLVDVTIKTLKFSQLESVCGGPIELAVVTTDGSFRWVRHKPFGAVIEQGGSTDA